MELQLLAELQALDLFFYNYKQEDIALLKSVGNFTEIWEEKILPYAAAQAQQSVPGTYAAFMVYFNDLDLDARAQVVDLALTRHGDAGRQRIESEEFMQVLAKQHV